ncbi:uncharacterized protein MONBRDRAFT_36876 [Monosiga brevicollis MX1]|uniref:Uncharacterized protein n=1 Tax=Monosiga brevicollis TaxID=81824 RepID=A9UXG7_MONBE|nr:uncharacterized protein MONBRDRAFT_36876 [Monosiga brevicollis MX1]EDQ89841.1 predicted protein [Monosiga brevicollis MX1]|eukprot:XP_001745263.1 hypothetical protein [Monosiga brevicollis MX1]
MPNSWQYDLPMDLFNTVASGNSISLQNANIGVSIFDLRTHEWTAGELCPDEDYDSGYIQHSPGGTAVNYLDRFIISHGGFVGNSSSNQLSFFDIHTSKQVHVIGRPSMFEEDDLTDTEEPIAFPRFHPHEHSVEGDPSVDIQSITVKGDWPRARDKHCACIHGPFMILMGGWARFSELDDLYRDEGQDHAHISAEHTNQAWLSSMHILDLRDLFTRQEVTWHRIAIDKGVPWPAPRAAFTLTPAPTQHCLYLFGGRTKDARCNDFWRFDLLRGEWTELAPTNAADQDRPAPRSWHVAELLHDRWLYIQGGLTVRDHAPPHGDLWAYDTCEAQWHRIDAPVHARLWHASCLWNETLLLFGGAVRRQPLRTQVIGPAVCLLQLALPSLEQLCLRACAKDMPQAENKQASQNTIVINIQTGETTSRDKKECVHLA